jgi:Fatty-acid desaturase
MTVAPTATPSATTKPQARPDIEPEPKGNFEKGLLAVFIVVPLLAVVAAVPFAWGWGLGWTDIAIMFVFYAVSGLGVTVGYHRHFTHGSFKAKRWLRIALGIAGGLSIEMSVIDWVAVHRRHTSTPTRRATRTRRGVSAVTGARSARA